MNISVTNARENNLKNVSLEIPRNKLVVFTGVSGSGKSSLVIDTIYAEAQRQYLESVGSFIQRSFSIPSKPDVDEISGLSSPVVIDQRRLGNNPRSTVGTVTEIYILLRLLYSRYGLPTLGDSNLFSFNNPEGMCPKCRGLGEELYVDPGKLIDFDKSLNEGAIRHSEYRINGRRWSILKVSNLFDMTKKLTNFSEEELDKLLYSPRIELTGSDKNGFVQKYGFEGVVVGMMRRRIDTRGLSISSEKRDQSYYQTKPCTDCHGLRLNKSALQIKILEKNISELSMMYLGELREFVRSIDHPIANPIVEKMTKKIDHLIDIGLGYLSINRPINTLSGGEAQRVKLAKQLGSSLIEQIYVLDEPSVGLHPRDIDKLIKLLTMLRDTSNSVLVVEHDLEMMRHADLIVDIGPGAGKNGGNITFMGTPGEAIKSDTLIGKYLKQSSGMFKKAVRTGTGVISITNANIHNLKNISVDIPKGILVSVTGVAGSGKSSLLMDVFSRENNVVIIDQAGVGKSSRSNPTTYVGIFDEIRKLFAIENNVSPSLFSFNSTGACLECSGLGYKEIEMHFLDSIKIRCDLCEGKRYKEEVLAMKYKAKSIFDLLSMTVEEAFEFFSEEPIRNSLNLLIKVGLGYLELGQPLNTLSGGEAQRIKLTKELSKKGNSYVLDEPTTGLHPADIEKLMTLLNELVDNGNSVIVIEHNLDVIRQSDWIIDMGPEGGDKGGTIVAVGTPEEIAKVKTSHTGRYI